MTTDEKAIEIYNLIYKQFIKNGYPEEIATTCAIGGKAGAEDMAEWQEQQMIEKACEYIAKYFYNHPHTNMVCSDEFKNVDDFIERFKLAMKGGEE